MSGPSDPYASSFDSTLAALESASITERLRASVSDFSPDLNIGPHIDALRRARSTGLLCPVLGAGISMPYLLPSWQDLVIGLHNEYLPPKPHDYVSLLLQRFGVSLISFTRFLISHSINPTAFLFRLRRLLYKDHHRALDDPNLQAIVDLIIGNDRMPPLGTTINYNIDDILERNIQKRFPDIRCKAIFTSSLFVEQSTAIRIVHPHGFLPLEDNDLSQYLGVVLSETAYHTHYLEYYNWANMAQLNALTHKTCLFIGLSFSDPNLRRLVDFSWTFVDRQHDHFVIKKTESDNHYNYFFQKDMEIIGVNVVWIQDYAQIRDVISQLTTP